MSIQFASRVDVLSTSDGLIFRTHREEARRMFEKEQAHLAPALVKKLARGGKVHVTQIFVLDHMPRAAKSRNGNSSKTTYVQSLATNRFNERGEPGRGIIRADVQQHKPIREDLAGFYGVRVNG